MRARIDLQAHACEEFTWMGLQIHGQYLALDSRVPMPPARPIESALLADFFGRAFSVIFATKTCTILSQAPTGLATFEAVVEATLPPVLPPSYRGQYCRCVYMASLGYRLREDPEIHTVHLPFKVTLTTLPPVLTPDELGRAVEAASGAGTAASPSSVRGVGGSPASPTLRFPWGYPDHDFKLNVVRVKDPMDKWRCSAECPLSAIFHKTTLHGDVTHIPARPSAMCPQHHELLPVFRPMHAPDNDTHQQQSYTIALGGKLIAQFTLLNPVLRPGLELSGVFDFNDAALQCVQVCAALEMQEWFPGDDTEPAGTTILSTVKRAMPAGVSRLPLSFPLPYDAPPSCSFNPVNLAWCVCFDLCVLNPAYVEGGKEGETSERAPRYLSVPWRLPVLMQPAHRFVAVVDSGPEREVFARPSALASLSHSRAFVHATTRRVVKA